MSLTALLPWTPAALKPNSLGPWSAAEDAFLEGNHGAMSVQQIADAMGRTHSSIRARITVKGLAKKVLWTPEEEAVVVAAYTAAGAAGFVDLAALAAGLGRSKANVCRKANKMGLGTNPSRLKAASRKSRRKFATDAEYRQSVSERMRLHIATHGHPRGMLGKKHTQAALEVISASSIARWAGLSEDEKAEHTMKAVKAKRAGHGALAPTVARGSWKAGWREIGGKRKYYRSRWEANYARYLEWLKVGGHIAEWQHEPETFWFEAIKRGVRSYLPDFRVWENDGSSCLHEVKGWMDSRSKTTLARMAKYHPTEKIILIDGKQYRAIRLKVMRLIPEWEDNARDTRA